MAEQSQIDRGNANFWDELCGTNLAQTLGITDASSESLNRYDQAYFGQYPYLQKYLPGPEARGQRVLEIGLGFGSVCRLLAARGLDYHGVDLAENPVGMARHRLSLEGVDHPEQRVVIGSALDLPHADESFDHVITIGCLHHTGDIPRGIAEVERVLRPGGWALVMLYNRHSYRRLKAGFERLTGQGGTDEEGMRAAYDHNSDGSIAPTTEYVCAWQARRLFKGFSKVRLRRENFDFLFRRGGEPIDRDFLLGWPARVAGLDLYITALK